MTLPEISIKRPVFAWMMMAALILFGSISYKRLGISSLPDVDFPVINISVTYEAAAPEIMELDVVDVIEDAVMTVEGVKSVTSKARYGNASITVEFGLDRNIDSAFQDVQTKVSQALPRLPDDVDPPVITKSNPEDHPILWIAVSSDTWQRKDLMRYVRDTLKDKFTTVSGVGEVSLAGYIEPNLRVWVSGKSLERYSLTVTDILNTIENEHAELPSGQIETSRKQYDVRTFGEAKSAEDFGRLVINQRGGSPNFTPIYLNQVSKIEEGTADVKRISRFQGNPAVGLGIKKQPGANAVRVALEAKRKMEEVKKLLPEGLQLHLNFDSTRFIEDAVRELLFTILLSALLTSLVCWVFLGSWSSTFNILLAIPTSIIGAFTIIYFAGFTLNTFTLLGLSLAIGIVVDDAIMVLENIVRYREKGLSRIEAARVGANEISFAAIATTIAIAAIFVPIAFMRGIMGKFFYQFGVTMTVAVFLSLLEALTLTPMRCSQFVEAGERTSAFGKFVERVFQRLANIYRRILQIALNHRTAVVILSLILFAGSLYVVKFLRKEFVPAQDQSMFLVRLKAPVDASMPYTDAKCLEAEAILKTNPNIERYYVAVGGFGGSEVSTGMFFVTLKDKDKRQMDPALGRKPTQQDLMGSVRADLSKISEVEIFIQDLSLRGFTASRGFPVEFSIRGPDWEKLISVSEEFMTKLKDSGMLSDIDTDYDMGKPEVRILPNRAQAARHGVSIRPIAQTVNAMVGGVVSGKFPIGGHRQDIRVRLQPEDRDRAEQIKHMWVRNNRGELISLSDLITLTEKPALQQITRYDRERAITISANVQPGKSQAQALDRVNEIGRQVLPKDYHIFFSGSAQTFKESFQDLLFALVLGIGVAYMVLASQFNSFIHPITVLIALPFSLSGAYLGLFLTGQSLNIYSFIGLILLMGIAKKNSILLVEFTNQLREHKNLSVKAALLEASPIRLRPILMTSFSTIAGALPAALALGPGAETRIPMAITVIGGMFVSTFLTLLVVPCVYSLLSNLESKKKKVPQAA